jgi:DHA1 family inner membrane transport protein
MSVLETMADPSLAVTSPPRHEAAISQGVGVVALLIAGLQPVILGALEREGRLSTAQIGLAATVELMALGRRLRPGGGLSQADQHPPEDRAGLPGPCRGHAGHHPGQRRRGDRRARRRRELAPA